MPAVTALSPYGDRFSVVRQPLCPVTSVLNRKTPAAFASLAEQTAFFNACYRRAAAFMSGAKNWIRARIGDLLSPASGPAGERLIRIHDFVPYDRSVIWSVHSNYFHARGAQAWLRNEVPYQVTSSYAAAFQTAAVVAAAVEQMEDEGSLAKTDPIEVLEMGAGLGLFAYNFIRAFRAVCRKRRSKAHLRLRYYLTDYSMQTIKDAESSSALSRLVERGTLVCRCLDALEPEELISSSGKSAPTPNSLAAVVQNYVHCCLPLTVVRLQEGQWYEKYTRVSFAVPCSVLRGKKYAAEAISRPIGREVQSNLIQEYRWERAGDSLFRRPHHRQLLETVMRVGGAAACTYPYGSLLSLERTVPLLRPGGIMLLSDKARPNLQWLDTEGNFRPTVHGNSLAYTLNFPVLRAYLSQCPGAVEQTWDEGLSVQTLMFEKRAAGCLGKPFRRAFVVRHISEDSMDFRRAANKYAAEHDHHAAVRFFRRALKCAPFDVSLIQGLAVSLFSLGKSDSALFHFLRGRKLDRFSTYDFSFQIGLVLQFLGRHKEALENFRDSLTRGEDWDTHYHIGQCLEAIGEQHWQEAFESYARAVQLDRRSKDARQRFRQMRRRLLMAKLRRRLRLK